MKRIVFTLLCAAALFLILRTLWEVDSNAIAPISNAQPLQQVAPPREVSDIDRSIQSALERLPQVEDIAKDYPRIETVEKSTATGFIPTAGCTSQRLLDILMKAPRPKHLGCIWDSTDFNPRRAAVTSADRERFLRALAPFMDSASELREITNRVGLTEFRQLVASRNSELPFMSHDDWLALARQRAPALITRALEESKTGSVDVESFPLMPTIAFDFDVNLLKSTDDGWYASRMADMKTARPSYEALAYTSLELVRAIIEFALQFGTITAAEAEELRAAAVQTFDRMVAY